MTDKKNEELEKNTEKLEEVKFEEPDLVDYKACLLESFKAVEDPFNTEIDGDAFDYQPNPANPSLP